MCANMYLYVRHHPACCTVPDSIASDNVAVPVLSQLQQSSRHKVYHHLASISMLLCQKHHSTVRCCLCITCRGGPRTCGSGAVGCTLGACLPKKILSLKSSSLNMLVRYGTPCWSDRIIHYVGQVWHGAPCLTSSFGSLLEEPCCPCTCPTATAVALCKLIQLGQHVLVMHNHTYIHQCVGHQMYVPLPHAVPASQTLSIRA